MNCPFNFALGSQSYAKFQQQFRDPFPTNRGKTHWLGGRIDLLFITDGLHLLHPLSRQVTHDAIRPTKLFRPHYRCADDDWQHCALSDHMPEGGLFAFERSN